MGLSLLVAYSCVRSSTTNNINKQDFYGYTALMNATRNGQIETAKKLIREGANPDIKSRHGDTALALAILNKYLDFAKILIDKGANLGIKNKYGNTALDVVLFHINKKKYSGEHLKYFLEAYELIKQKQKVNQKARVKVKQNQKVNQKKKERVLCEWEIMLRDL